MRRIFSVICIAMSFGLAGISSGDVFAQSATAKGASGLPLPRFVSLKSKRVNMRIGPSTDYAVSWLYTKAGIPVEIIQEYENWRRIRDADGTEGWVNQALVSGDRTAVAAPWMRGKGEGVYVNMRRDAQSGATVVARVQPGAIIKISECTGDWCKAEAEKISGWVSQGELWGAYPGEAFK